MLDTADPSEVHHTNSVTLKKMMSETIMPDPFNLPCHILFIDVQHDLDSLLQEYESQFIQDETIIGTTPLTSMTIFTGTTNPVLQKPYPITMKHYQWVKTKLKSYLLQKLSTLATPAGQHPS